MARTKTTIERTYTVQPVELPPSTVDVATLPNLYHGVAGRAVYIRMLQEALNRKGFRCPITSVYDLNTVRAVQRMQITNKLLPDARVGVREWEVLTG